VVYYKKLSIFTERKRMGSRKYKLITGVCYTDLYKDADQPRKVKYLPNDRENFYRDDAVRLSHKDVSEFRARPIMLEHGFDLEDIRERFGVVDTSQPVGEVFQSSVDSDGYMRISARIFVDTPAGEKIYKAVESGDLRGLSVGYRPQFKDHISGEIDYKLFDEVSLCKQPFFEGAQVSVTASNLQSEQGKNFWFQIMSEQTEQATPATATPVPENKEARELLRNTDSIAQELAQKEAQIKELMEKIAKQEPLANAELQRREEEERKAEEERNRMAEQIVSVIKEVMQTVEPEKAKIADERTLGFLSQGLRHKNSENIPAVFATALERGLQGIKREEELSKELEQYKTDFAATSNKLKQVTENSRVTASMEAVLQTGEKQEEQQGSIENIFAIPKDEVLREWGMTREEATVRASQRQQMEKPKLPTHRYEREMGAGMRGTDQSTFAFICQNMKHLNQIPTRMMKRQVDTFNPPVAPSSY